MKMDLDKRLKIYINTPNYTIVLEIFTGNTGACPGIRKGGPKF